MNSDGVRKLESTSTHKNHIIKRARKVAESIKVENQIEARRVIVEFLSVKVSIEN